MQFTKVGVMAVKHVHDFLWLDNFFVPGTNYWTGPEISGLDIETEVFIRADGMQAGLFPLNGEIASVQIALGDLVYVVQIPEDVTLLEVPGVRNLISYLESKDVKKIIHNAIFEHSWFIAKLSKWTVTPHENKIDGMSYCPSLVWDTMVAEYILAEGRVIGEEKGEYKIADSAAEFKQNRKKLGLDSVVQRYYSHEMDKDQAIRTSFRRGEKLSSRQLDYAAFDAWWVQKLYLDQKDQMSEKQLNLMDLDCAMTEAVARMILHGMPVDIDSLCQRFAIWNHELLSLEDQIKSIFALPEDGTPILTAKTGKQKIKDGQPVFNELNLNSNKQMPERLQQFGINVPSYEADELRHFLDFMGIKEILQYKKIQKVVSTNVEPFIEKINIITSNIHADFQITTTNTGRPSCENPNLQNIPIRSDLGRELRKSFRPKPGNKLIIADLSNIELRLIAENFNDPVMKQAFAEDLDLHSIMGSVIEAGVATSDWDVLMELYYPFKARVDAEDTQTLELRHNGKTTNFMFGYGAGPERASLTAWKDYGLLWSVEFATQMRDLYRTIFNGVYRFHRKRSRDISNANDRFYVEDLEGRGKWVSPDGGYSESLNHPIQATVSEIIKYAHVEVCRIMDICIDVHDCIIAEVQESEAEDMALILVDAMQRAGERYLHEVPMKTDYKIVDYWKK